MLLWFGVQKNLSTITFFSESNLEAVKQGSEVEEICYNNWSIIALCVRLTMVYCSCDVSVQSTAPAWVTVWTLLCGSWSQKTIEICFLDCSIGPKQRLYTPHRSSIDWHGLASLSYFIGKRQHQDWSRDQKQVEQQPPLKMDQTWFPKIWCWSPS